MNIGYACLCLGVPGTELHTCTLKNAVPERLRELCHTNLNALEEMILYNIRHGIRLFRISSDLIPFASHPDVSFDWAGECAARLAEIGKTVQESGMRISMHPGQYTVLNSPDSGVVERAVEDLRYHNRVLDLLGLPSSHKIVLHIGGAYGDKEEALRRFERSYLSLEDAVKRRLVIENDDRIYHIGEVLETGDRLGIPVIFDILHHQVNPPPRAISWQEWASRAFAAWNKEDGPPKVHYPQQAEGKKPGSHSETVEIESFLDFYRSLPEAPDIMLEVKDKNLSAVKCILSVKDHAPIRLLEEEWGRYKYLVLERDPAAYQEIRTLLKDKSSWPAVPFYQLVQQALTQPVEPGRALNALQHVAGYFTKTAEEGERKRLARALQRYREGTLSLAAAKRQLLRLAQTHGEEYLLQSLYFLDR